MVARKLESTLTRATNYKFKATSKEKQKRREMVKRRKTEAIATKR